MVRVDAVLQAAVQNPNTVAVSWEDLMGLIIGRMSHSYQMTFSGEKTVAQKGKLDPIDIHVGKRTGNKKVTMICVIFVAQKNMSLYKELEVFIVFEHIRLLNCNGILSSIKLTVNVLARLLTFPAEYLSLIQKLAIV
jgi:hypothetical protein